MAAIVFDVREAERRLLDAGAPPEVAEATADLMSEAVVHNLDALVTRDYLDHVCLLYTSDAADEVVPV